MDYDVARVREWETNNINFEQVGEYSSDLVFRLDDQLCYSYANPQVERVLGVGRERLLGSPILDFPPHDQVPIYLAHYRRAITEQAQLSFEVHCPQLSRWLLIHCLPDDDGGIVVIGRVSIEREPAKGQIGSSTGGAVHGSFQAVLEGASDMGDLISATDREHRFLLSDQRERAVHRLRRLFESQVVGVIFWNLDTGHITDANDHFLSIVGYSRDDLANGRLNFREMTPAEWTERNEEGVASIRQNGSAPTYEKEYFRKDGSRVPILIGGTRFEDSGTEGFSYVIDISDRKQLEREQERLLKETQARAERESLLSDASRTLNASLDYNETLAAVARLIVPRFADWCSVDILDDAGNPQRVAVEHVDPQKVAWGWELHRRYPTSLMDERGIGAVLRTGKPSYIPVVNDEMLVAAIKDSERLRLMTEIGFTSVLIVPLVVREQVFGAISLIATRESGRTFTEEDVRLAQEIGNRAALAVENARLFQAVQRAEVKQRRIADILQESMLLGPHSDDEYPGIRIDDYYEAARDEAQIGGDYGDVFRVAENRVAILVGDCTGKGLEAARFVAECKFMARAFLRENPDDPAQALCRLNTILINGQNLDKRSESALTTLVVAVIETTTGRVLVSAGAAEPPLLLRAASGRAEEVEAYGPLLGMDPQAQFETVHLALDPGDLLLLTTDGTTEARNRKTRQFFGYDGLLRAAEEIVRASDTVHGIARKIAERAKLFAGGVLSDDVCIVAAQFIGNSL